MASSAKQPPVYKLSSDDYPMWQHQFENYADALKLEDKDRFVTLKSFLDSPAFTIVQNLDISADQMADPKLYKPILEAALIRKDTIPPRMALKYRTQQDDESLYEFATALENLANRANVEKEVRPLLLVDSFCTGVRDAELSVKLLENSFASLALALDKAEGIARASKIRNFARPPTTETPQVESSLEILASNSSPPQQHNSGRQSYQQGRNRNPRASSDIPSNNNQGAEPSSSNRFQPRNNSARNARRCWYCNRPGHVERTCWKKFYDEHQNFPVGPSLPQ